jgi:hypothetical protein
MQPLDYATRKLLEDAYSAFNARNIDAALAAMHPDVTWPNGTEGGYLHGHEEVRDYWSRQWRMIDPEVAPMALARDPSGRVIVDVRLVVRDLTGRVQADEVVQHAFTIEGGRVRAMEIR